MALVVETELPNKNPLLPPPRRPIPLTPLLARLTQLSALTPLLATLTKNTPRGWGSIQEQQVPSGLLYSYITHFCSGTGKLTFTIKRASLSPVVSRTSKCLFVVAPGTNKCCILAPSSIEFRTVSHGPLTQIPGAGQPGRWTGPGSARPRARRSLPTPARSER